MARGVLLVVLIGISACTPINDGSQDTEMRGGPLHWNQDVANTYVGKSILVGLTYFDHMGNELRSVQMHGIIESATRKGIRISPRGSRIGQSWVMPPALDSISPAEPGIYTLRSTGEKVANPDLLATWAITEPPK